MKQPLRHVPWDALRSLRRAQHCCFPLDPATAPRYKGRPHPPPAPSPLVLQRTAVNFMAHIVHHDGRGGGLRYRLVDGQAYMCAEVGSASIPPASVCTSSR